MILTLYGRQEYGLKKEGRDSTLFWAKRSNATKQLLSQLTRNSTRAIVSQSTRSYDANGNVTSEEKDGQITLYTWNAQNFLTGVTAPDGTSESYTYCGEGIRRTVTDASGTRSFIRDGKRDKYERA